MDIDVPCNKVVFVEVAARSAIDASFSGCRAMRSPVFLGKSTQLKSSDTFVILDSENSLRISLPAISVASGPVEIRTVQNNVTHFVSSTGSDLMYNGSQSTRLGVGGKNMFCPRGNVWYMV
jgi:hypothetical protein